MPTINVSRGLGAPSPLESAADAGIDKVSFVPLGGTTPMTWQDALQAN